MADRPLHVLFLCTGNSARSILAEQLLNHHAHGRLRGFSAGSHPKGTVHPLAIELLGEMNLPVAGLRSKSWQEFASPSAPQMDFVITLCDSAAAEQCPVWPGQPITAHWGVEDPAAATGSAADKKRAFHRAFLELDRRVRIFVKEIGRAHAQEPAST